MLSFTIELLAVCVLIILILKHMAVVFFRIKRKGFQNKFDDKDIDN